MIDEQRCLVAYLDRLQAKVNALPAHAFGRLQVKGRDELRPFFGRTLMASALDEAFRGEL
ncbi:MAG: hypothetical protein QM730_24680 [Anaerolineales bacterium]